MKIIFSTLFLLANFSVYSQNFKADDHFQNGQLKFKGKYTSCVIDFVGGVHIYEKRKTGKWIYYHASGGIKKIEYHTKTKSCKTDIYKEGKWQYFNEEGELYLEEKYELDTLQFKETPVYNKDQLAAKITFQGGKTDTVFYFKPAKSKNLIPNPGFETYFFKPVNITNDGQDNIEEIIPYWNSPDDATPDYYNNYRKIAGVSNNLGNDKAPAEGTGYIGLMIYFHPKYKFDAWEPANKVTYGNEYVYSESIQSRLSIGLKKNKKYCFKAQIILSHNAGLSIDKFGAYFSETDVEFKRDDFPGTAQLSFDEPFSSTNEWTTLCSVYTALGNERFITLGRFENPNLTNLSFNTPAKSSELDINKSAYYLLDDIQLFEVSSIEECNCAESIDNKIEKEELTNDNLVDYFDINSENKVILRNVLFDFDSTNFRKSSLPELQILHNYLSTNPDIKILITGHTDNEGSAEYNEHLSLHRAMAIKHCLVKNGIESSRISCAGKGFDAPVENNSNEYNKSVNRRVEFEIVDK